mmetsp:Transcript_3960/g.5489  ORF Transcript_3960/g.5489 Transcript_3960/m.5489 type:complete len:366 (-) Transcript_3960:34-1131(-)
MWVPLHKMPSFSSSKRRYQKSDKYRNSFLLKKPVTTKLGSENALLNGMEIGHSSMQGYRVTMEDQHIITVMSTLNDHTLLAIMDGHAGALSAQYTAAELMYKIERSSAWNMYLKVSPEDRKNHCDLISRSLIEAYVAIDEGLLNLTDMDFSGCTAVCTVITPWHIICANVGDSRCVIRSNGVTIAMTEDHKPSQPLEKLRIENAQGFVVMDRVNGELAMSRALGDFRYKTDITLDDKSFMVICYPDISVHERRPDLDEVMVLACDGVWDVINNDEAVDYIADIVLATEEADEKENEMEANVEDDNDEGKKRKRSLSSDNSAVVVNSSVTALEAAESLIDLALSNMSTDNISAVVVKFPKMLQSKL